jgi:drug/metabolite transporter (DMT)-like permease
MNACAKTSSVAHGPVEMVFYRGVVALGLLVPYMLITHPVSVFKTRRIGGHLYRAVVGNIGVGLVFWAYALLPMANATALLFSSPLFVAALSPFLLKERVHGGRWMAVATGFAGILLIARPSVNLMADPASMVGLGAALCIGLVDMALRNLGRTENPLTTVFYFILGGVILSAPYTVGIRHPCRMAGFCPGSRVSASLPPFSNWPRRRRSVLPKPLFWRHTPTRRLYGPPWSVGCCGKKCLRCR